MAAVGKPRDAALAAAIRQYEERAAHYWPLEIVEVKEEPARGAERDGGDERVAHRLADGVGVPGDGVGSVRASGRAVDVLVVGDRREAIRQAVRSVWRQGSAATVAVVGKGHETGQDVGGVVHPFVDRDEALEALRLASAGRSA